MSLFNKNLGNLNLKLDFISKNVFFFLKQDLFFERFFFLSYFKRFFLKVFFFLYFRVFFWINNSVSWLIFLRFFLSLFFFLSGFLLFQKYFLKFLNKNKLEELSQNISWIIYCKVMFFYYNIFLLNKNYDDIFKNNWSTRFKNISSMKNLSLSESSDKNNKNTSDTLLLKQQKRNDLKIFILEHDLVNFFTFFIFSLYKVIVFLVKMMNFWLLLPFYRVLILNLNLFYNNFYRFKSYLFLIFLVLVQLFLTLFQTISKVYRQELIRNQYINLQVEFTKRSVKKHFKYLLSLIFSFGYFNNLSLIKDVSAFIFNLVFLFFFSSRDHLFSIIISLPNIFISCFKLIRFFFNFNVKSLIQEKKNMEELRKKSR